jgi:prolyl oligopeptidase
MNLFRHHGWRHPFLFFRAVLSARRRKRMGLPMTILVLGALGLLAQTRPSPAPTQANMPTTRRDSFKETLHGVEIADPYRWLEDQQSPETRTWINQQTAYTKQVLGGFPGRAGIVKRLAELDRVDRVTQPYSRAGRYFFRRRGANEEQYRILMREGLSGAERALVDPKLLGLAANSSVDLMDLSLDGRLLAYGLRDGGQDEVAVRVMEVSSGELRDQMPKRRYGNIAITPDKAGAYYSINGDDTPRIYYHAFGRAGAEDAEVFGRGYGASHLMYPQISDDGRWLWIIVYHGSAATQTDIYAQDLKAGTPLRPVFKDIPSRFSAMPAGDRFIVVTNHNAPQNRIISVDPSHPEPANWKELVPQSEFPIEEYAVSGGKIYAMYLEDVKSRIKVFDGAGKYLNDVRLPSAGTASGLSGEWSHDELFYTFESFHIAPEIHRVAAGADTVWAQRKVPVQPGGYELKQVFYNSKDGTRVPMFLLHKRGLKPDGNLPVLLYGYGGFTVSETAGFSPFALAWADRGGVYAVANLRGGGEYGEAWHAAGAGANKQNVFDDFIAAAEWLIANHYTNPKRLAIRGGSNGGLLVGAAMVQRPELFQSVVCAVPLLDMLRFHKFLVARFWVPEYGSADDATQFAYLRKYSPYHNVKAQVDYPAAMFVTGDGDTRVAPLHARKMAALVQASTAGKRPVILHYDTEAGHSAGLAASKKVEDDADQLLFLSGTLGVKQ